MSALLEVRNLAMHFRVGRHQAARAVDGVSFSIGRGETLGLVGESGCGKTTVGRSIIRLYDPTAGEIVFDGTDLAHLSQREMLPFRRRMQMIFQDPYASLNPRMTVGDIVMEPMTIHSLHAPRERRERARELLRTVGLNSEHANRYPHEFSGGQRQRIGIARSLAASPEFIVCDEPISALDVSIQAQIVNTLEDLQKEFSLTYLFIAHDLSMVKHISDRIAVMYLGTMVEIAGSNELYTRPLHPYTEALLSAIPVPDPDRADERRRIPLEGEIPNPINPPPGCKFHTRCRYAESRCREVVPELTDRGNGHYCACLVK
jgi:oligopeptide transport system ATP-binding protein